MSYLHSYRTINELTDQLEYERLRREKLEALLDNYKREINHLNRALDNAPIQVLK